MEVPVAKYTVGDVIRALQAFPEDMPVWEWAEPGGPCPLHALPRQEYAEYTERGDEEEPWGYWDFEMEPSSDSAIKVVVI